MEAGDDGYHYRVSVDVTLLVHRTLGGELMATKHQEADDLFDYILGELNSLVGDLDCNEDAMLADMAMLETAREIVFEVLTRGDEG